MGARRGTGHAGRFDPIRWWARSSSHHQRLGEWLDHVASAGYVELVLASRAVPLSFELRAYRQDRTAGYAVLLVGGSEELWLQDHWPSELVTHREQDRVVGRLHAAAPVPGSS
jgi:hypothetical protein